MRVALVHDHLTQFGGAEKVLTVLHEMYPAAPIYTLVYNAGRLGRQFDGSDIRTSFLQRLPGGMSHYKWFLPLMPWATEQYRLEGYDVVISSSSAFAKGVLTNEKTLHLCYCHTPTRYLWSDTHAYVSELPYPRPLRLAVAKLLVRLRTWDYAAAQRPDVFIANSAVVQRRIKKYYRRESVVIYPPVDLSPFSPAPGPDSYFLTGGRLVGYKRFDLVVQAFNRLRLPLKIFGEGPERPRLEALAKPNVTFVGWQSLPSLALLYAHARAFINPQEEDFGITAVEAMAAGRPVIAYARGGALETVVPGRSGSFFTEQTWEALADTVVRFRDEAFSPSAVRADAERFSTQAFRDTFSRAVAGALAVHREQGGDHAPRS